MRQLSSLYRKRNWLASIVAIVFLGFLNNMAHAETIDVWIGTGGANGIFYLTLDKETGKLSKPRSVASFAGAGFLTIHPDGKTLYSTAQQDGDAGVAAFRIELAGSGEDLKKLMAEWAELSVRLGQDHPRIRDLARRIDIVKSSSEKKLKKLNFESSGDGGAACVAIDKAGKVLFSAQYGGGSTTSYLLADDHSIERRVSVMEHGKGSGVNRDRQADSHPHWVGTSPDNRYLFVPDLGKDAVVGYQLNQTTGELRRYLEIPTPPGAGPRHMKFSVSGDYVYVLNELSLTMSVFSYEKGPGHFNNIQLVETLPDSMKDKHLNSAAEVRVHPNGKFVYASNRGHDSITVFSVNEANGKLSLVEREPIRGAWPRNFNVDPSGKWLLAAGRHSNTLAVFEIDQTTGELTYHRQIVNIPAPICVLFGK